MLRYLRPVGGGLAVVSLTTLGAYFVAAVTSGHRQPWWPYVLLLGLTALGGLLYHVGQRASPTRASGPPTSDDVKGEDVTSAGTVKRPAEPGGQLSPLVDTRRSQEAWHRSQDERTEAAMVSDLPHDAALSDVMQPSTDSRRPLQIANNALSSVHGEVTGDAMSAAAIAAIPGEPDTNIGGASYGSVLTGSKIKAWGANDSGQCDVPERLVGVSAIAASPGYSLAITGRGQIASWGKTDHRTGPQRLSVVKTIAAGRWHSLALTGSGEVVAWLHAEAEWDQHWRRQNPQNPSILPAPPHYPSANWGRYGESRFQRRRRERMAEQAEAEFKRKEAEKAAQREAARLHALDQFKVPAHVSGVVGIAAGAGFSVALCRNETSTVSCWGPYCPEMNLESDEIADLVAIDAGDDYCIGLKADGTVVAWGKPRAACEIPLGLTGVIAIAAGESHGLALVQDGTVAAWGDNDSNQRDVPVGLSNVVAIAAGKSHSLALRSDGTVVSWGGSESDRPPERLTGVRAIAASSHSLAIHD